MTDYLTIEGTYNIRDLGGFPVDGGKTRSRAFIRAGNLDQLLPQSQQQLIDYGVKTVIDLRDEWEARDYPNVFAQSQSVCYLNLPLIGDDLAKNASWQKHTQDYDTLHELYNRYLDGCQTQIGAIMTALAESPSTVIFHCYAGKDRTGIIAGLLMATVGVPDELIAQDYALSKQNIMHLIEQWRAYALQNGRDMQQLERDAASDTATMLSMLAYLRDRYGTVSKYLHACGVSEQQLKQLRSRFVDAGG